MLVYTGVCQHPTRKAAESKRVDTGSTSATTIQMQAATENPGAMARLQVPNLREQQVHDLQDMEGVTVSSRTTKRQRKLWEILLTEKALGSEAVWEALVCKGSLTAFGGGLHRKAHGNVYWWCDTNAQALHHVVQSSTQLGMVLCPTMVRTAKHGSKQAWLCNGQVWLQTPEAAGAVGSLRRQGVAISVSWEPHLLQLTNIPSKHMYFKGMACVPNGDTAHETDEMAQLQTCVPPSEWSPGLPLQAMGDATMQEPAAGCVMTPVLNKRGVTWVVPSVPSSHLLALAAWLAEHRLDHLEVQQGNLQDAAAGLAEPALRCGQAHKGHLTHAIEQGQWAEQGLPPGTNPKPLHTKQCAWCAGIHSKHVCPHGTISQMLMTCKAQSEAEVLTRLAIAQQTQRIHAALQVPQGAVAASQAVSTTLNKQRTAVQQFWRSLTRSPLQQATPQPACADQAPNQAAAETWQVARGTSRKRRQQLPPARVVETEEKQGTNSPPNPEPQVITAGEQVTTREVAAAFSPPRTRSKTRAGPPTAGVATLHSNTVEQGPPTRANGRLPATMTRQLPPRTTQGRTATEGGRTSQQH